MEIHIAVMVDAEAGIVRKKDILFMEDFKVSLKKGVYDRPDGREKA